MDKKLMDIVKIIKANKCDFKWLDNPSVRENTIKVFASWKYDTFLEDVQKYPNCVFHILPNWNDNENPIWNNNMMRYLITTK